MKESRVLLVRITLGRGTVRKHPLNADQLTNLFAVEQKGNNHGLMIEMIPAIKKFNCFYRVIKLPDESEIPGDIFFEAKNYEAIPDSPYTRKGLCSIMDEINCKASRYMKMLQKSQKTIERYLESLV